MVIVARPLGIIVTALRILSELCEFIGENTVSPALWTLACLNVASKLELSQFHSDELLSAIHDILNEPSILNEKVRSRIEGKVIALDELIQCIIENKRSAWKKPCILLINFFRSHQTIPVKLQQSSFYICLLMLHFTPLIIDCSEEEVAASSLLLASKMLNFEVQLVVNWQKWWLSFSPNIEINFIQRICTAFVTYYRTMAEQIRQRIKKSLLDRLNLFICIADNTSAT